MAEKYRRHPRPLAQSRRLRPLHPLVPHGVSNVQISPRRSPRTRRTLARGRTNHYYFDLNRDWAWATQVETRQRLKLYQRWLPHVHADLHEQYPNNPYYFAPAAEPMHDYITPLATRFPDAYRTKPRRLF
jgi:hypothetical protein